MASAFFADANRIVPWSQVIAAVEPFYPKVSEAGDRPPIPLERMLRVYVLGLWINLSDPAEEEVPHGSKAGRIFAGIDLGSEAAPDESTVCRFRHFSERNLLSKKLLSTVNEHLQRSGIKITNGTIVDATIISAPFEKPWHVSEAYLTRSFTRFIMPSRPTYFSPARIAEQFRNYLATRVLRLNDLRPRR